MVHTMLLQIYEQRGSKEVAAEYQALIGLRPTDAKLYFRYGLYLEKAGDSRAVNEYRRAAALEPSNPDYQGALGNAYYRAKNYGAAAGAYRRATECDGGAKYMMKSQYVGDFDQNTFRLDQQRAYARYRKQLQDNQ
jgi:tetratricopeptide (TPR) repeat protein